MGPSIVNCVILCQFWCFKLLVNIFIQFGFDSANRLSVEEKDLITKDQKYSSRFAQVYYRKQSSREIALKARECMKKLQDSPDEIKKDFSADSFEQKLHTDFKNRLRPRASSFVRLKGQQKHRAQ